METIFEKFTELLEKECGLYGSLLEILQTEKEALVGSRIEELQEILKVKENLLLKIRILEDQRHRSLRKIAELLELKAQDVTLKRLSNIIGEPHSSKLKNCSSKLLSIAQSIQEINNSNRSLLIHSIELVRGSMNLFMNIMPSSQVYKRNGSMYHGDESGRNLSGVF